MKKFRRKVWKKQLWSVNYCEAGKVPGHLNKCVTSCRKRCQTSPSRRKPLLLEACQPSLTVETVEKDEQKQREEVRAIHALTGVFSQESGSKRDFEGVC